MKNGFLIDFNIDFKILILLILIFKELILILRIKKQICRFFDVRKNIKSTIYPNIFVQIHPKGLLLLLIVRFMWLRFNIFLFYLFSRLILGHFFRLLIVINFYLQELIHFNFLQSFLFEVSYLVPRESFDDRVEISIFQTHFLMVASTLVWASFLY